MAYDQKNAEDATPCYGVPLKERGACLLRWRSALGWSVAQTAERLGVSTRTISLMESGVQNVPDARWRLFIHELLTDINRGREADLVVVVAVDEGDPLRRSIPIDVVSKDNYAGFAISTDRRKALIASYAIDRESGRPTLHRQEFLVAHNPHVFKAIDRWEEMRLDATSDRAAFEMHRWLTRRALQGDLAIPGLARLKTDVDRLSAAAAKEGDEEARAKLQKKLDASIAKLMEMVAKAV